MEAPRCVHRGLKMSQALNVEAAVDFKHLAGAIVKGSVHQRCHHAIPGLTEAKSDIQYSNRRRENKQHDRHHGQTAQPDRLPNAAANPIELPFEVVSVKRDGKAESFHTEKESNGVRVYIGQENYLLPPGKYTFEITYTTNFQLGFFDSRDELYWNVTGNGWDFPIDRASASVSLPDDVPLEEISHEGYTGLQGSKDTNLTSEVNKFAGTVDFATTKSLGS